MISHKEAISLLIPYIRKRLFEQIKAVLMIVTYMIAFQIFVLKTPLQDASSIAFGLSLVIIGLAFFMEGLVLGLMPLGETLGLKLPRKIPLIILLIFAFAIGMGATFAEPAIGVLRAAGKDVTPWQSPLLFRLLNTDSDLLIYSVSFGVGCAVSIGVIRYIYHFSLKPILYLGVLTTLIISLFSSYNNELRAILGLAWDCGAVTTGPVTVPLVLSLGVGISRISGGDQSETRGFGIVTLASMFPIASVLLLSIFLNASTPKSMPRSDFFNEGIVHEVMPVFKDKSHYNSYKSIKGLEEQQKKSHIGHGLLKRSVRSALQAILPLCIGMILVLIFLARERLTHGDEVSLGIIFAIIGMSIFNIGIELGLANIGKQVGHILPAAYEEIEMGEKRFITNFNEDFVYTASTVTGSQKKFFFLKEGGEYKEVPFIKENFDSKKEVYTFKSTQGPLFGNSNNRLGTIIVILFAFIMGYGATLAEPALNALGSTVENVTAGSFSKRLLMHSVAIGVGLGLTLGLLKIIWDVPLITLLIPPYLVLLALTFISSESFVNIAWDSAGVTTGPITVPLVIAMGLGVGNQAGALEGFGILAMASVCPILIVLIVGLFIQSKQLSSVSSSPFESTRTDKNLLEENASEEEERKEQITTDESA